MLENPATVFVETPWDGHCHFYVYLQQLLVACEMQAMGWHVTLKSKNSKSPDLIQDFVTISSSVCEGWWTYPLPGGRKRSA